MLVKKLVRGLCSFDEEDPLLRMVEMNSVFP
jgi:hypothetical protein